ncbi:MAG: hypothetical protein ACI9PU_001416, partial [Ascidiaceihabitans sp.]
MCNNARIMADWNDLKYVSEAVRQNGLSGAARVFLLNICAHCAPDLSGAVISLIRP